MEGMTEGDVAPLKRSATQIRWSPPIGEDVTSR